LGIVLAELDDELSMSDSKRFQTELAEASIVAALNIMLDEIRRRNAISDLELNVLALGKLGGRGIDFGSDLDIVLVYPNNTSGEARADIELYHRAVEIFVTTLSGMTRDGNLYRVDLRLRPYGKNGASANPRSVFIDYFKKVAAVWELLAFVKLRAVNGAIADEVETEVREIIHHRARETAGAELRSETIRIRQLLEREKAGRESASDIKYGPGGLLDVYFAVRYLQLRDNVRDGVDDRSTRAALTMLWETGSISADDLESLSVGYAFLSELDHNIRLTTGRSRHLPSRNATRNIIARRMNFSGPDDLMGSLALHRIGIRKAFENILSG
jgi:glutamate-ammonia-ligase adenylyltransferase